MIPDDPSVIEQHLTSLKSGFLSQKTKKISFRKAQLQNLVRGLNELKGEFAAALNKDLNYDEFYADIFSHSTSINEVEHTLENFQNWAKVRPMDTTLLVGPAKSYVMPEPLGVVLVMSAWNYPVYTAIPPVAQAISAGNCVVLKPSELAPHSSNVLRKLFDKYLDSSCYRCIEGKIEIAKKIITYPWNLIVFTGSVEKGKMVARAAAENLTPVLLELGGKSPTVVDKGADMENAVLRVCQGKFTNSGQTCVAPDYVFVHKSIKDEFLNRMKAKIQTFFGSRAERSSDFPRMITEFHAKRIEDMVKDSHGGTVLYGGDADPQNRYCQPTIIEKPNPDCRLMKEEIFGPVLPVYEFTDISEVIKFINDRPNPLVLYYFGSICSKNKKILMQQTSSGQFSINETLFHLANSDLPFGGVNQSGMGAYHGQAGFDSCSHLKPVLDKLALNCWPFSCRYPPYTDNKKFVMRLLMRYMNIRQRIILRNTFIFGVVVAALILKKKGILATLNKYFVNWILKYNNIQIKN